MRIIYLPVPQKGHHLRRIGHDDGKIGKDFILLWKPDRIVQELIFIIQHQVSDPVHIQPLHHFDVSRLQCPGHRIDIYFPIQYRCRERFRVESDFIGLPAIDLQTIDQEIFIE